MSRVWRGTSAFNWSALPSSNWIVTTVIGAPPPGAGGGVPCICHANASGEDAGRARAGSPGRRAVQLPLERERRGRGQVDRRLDRGEGLNVVAVLRRLAVELGEGVPAVGRTRVYHRG